MVTLASLLGSTIATWVCASIYLVTQDTQAVTWACIFAATTCIIAAISDN